jgi:hypothetical protein
MDVHSSYANHVAGLLIEKTGIGAMPNIAEMDLMIMCHALNLYIVMIMMVVNSVFNILFIWVLIYIVVPRIACLISHFSFTTIVSKSMSGLWS